MAEYRYLLGDLLTRQVQLEVPMFGVWYTKRINKPGSSTFSFALGTEGFSDSDLIDNTIPGRSFLLIERNQQLVWGGPIWSRVYESQGHSLQFSGQTFESYFYKQIIESDISQTNTDQREILRQLIMHMASKPYADIGIQVPGSPYSGGVLRTANFKASQVWTYGKAIEYLIGYDQGFDYTLDVLYDTNGDPAIRLNTALKLGQPLQDTQLTFDYPGNIKNYWYPESAADGVTTMIGIGAGDGASMKRTKYTIQPLLDAGFPDLQDVYTNKDVSVIETLSGQTKQAALLAQVPVSVPTFETNPDVDPMFGDYRLGDYAKVTLEDPRFPDGKELYTRVIGWDVTTSGNDTEEVKIVTEGGEDS